MQLRISSGPNAGQTIDITREFTVGRESGNDLVLNDTNVSRRHASFRPLPDGRVTLFDLGSANGTYVNGQRVQSTVLSGTEQIQIGTSTLTPVAAPATVGVPGAQGATPLPTQQPTPPPQQQVAPPGPPPPQPQQQQNFQFQTPSPEPISRPSRTQSAIQRIMLQRAVNRATIVGIAAIVIAITVGALAAFGVFSSEGPSNADIIAEAEPSTFFIVNQTEEGGVGRGSGWVWDASEGLIVTNAHVTTGGARYVVASGETLRLDAQDGQVVINPGGKEAELVGEALCEDIAVLRVSDASGLQDLPRGTQDELRIGDRVIAAGYPGTANTTESDVFEEGFAAGDLTGSSGDVSQVETTFQEIPGESPSDPVVGPYQNVILTTTVINQGNSGGPLLNEDGELVGMNSAGRTDIVGQNYAVGVDRIEEIVPRLIAGEDVCSAS